MGRAERRHRTRSVVAARIHEWLQRMTAPSMAATGELPPPNRVGRWKKHKPFDCGKPQCGICHGVPSVGVGPRSLPPVDEADRG